MHYVVLNNCVLFCLCGGWCLCEGRYVGFDVASVGEGVAGGGLGKYGVSRDGNRSDGSK